MDEITTAAFFEELGSIEKDAGFVGKGLKALGSIIGGGSGTLSRAAARAGKAAAKEGTKPSRLGGHWELGKRFFRAGAAKAEAAGQNKTWGGIKRLAKSPYGAAAAVGTGAAAVPFAVGRMTADRR